MEDDIVMVALQRIGGGIAPVSSDRSQYRMGKHVVHAKKRSASGRRDFSFNYGAAAFRADFELWVCGTADLWYLVPTAVLRKMYAHPDAYVDTTHQQLRVVNINPSDHRATYASGSVRLSLAPYRCAVLPGAEWRALDAEVELERLRVLRAVVDRPEQRGFRDALLSQHDGRCVITGCDVPAALEAAHIKPVAEDGPDEGDNGLLLRADLHMLFDVRLLVIDPTDPPAVLLSPRLRDSTYGELHRKPLHGRLSAGQLASLRRVQLRT